jgi:hypothetical protein
MMKRPGFGIFGERSLTLVGAPFPDLASAEAAQRNLTRDAELDGEVILVGPEDPLTAMKLEPEPRGIWYTMLRTHAFFGVAGFALGLLASAALWWSGWPAARLNAGYMTLFVTVLFTFADGMLGGLPTLRPDHAMAIRELRRALKHRQSAVLVRPTSENHPKLAMQRLQQCGASPLRSFQDLQAAGLAARRIGIRRRPRRPPVRRACVPAGVAAAA